jgi:hypothetical protein
MENFNPRPVKYSNESAELKTADIFTVYIFDLSQALFFTL